MNQTPKIQDETELTSVVVVSQRSYVVPRDVADRILQLEVVARVVAEKSAGGDYCGYDAEDLAAIDPESVNDVWISNSSIWFARQILDLPKVKT